MALDLRQIQEALLEESESKYASLSEIVLKTLRLNYFSIERIYLSRSDYDKLAVAGRIQDSDKERIVSISALGHPNLGRMIASSKTIDEDTLAELKYLGTLLGKQFQVDWMRNLMRTLSEPIPWEDDDAKYLERLASTCRQAAAAAHIAIREDVDGKLTASAWDSREQKIDFRPIKSIPSDNRIGKIICPPKEDDRIHFHGPKSEVVAFMRQHLAYDLIQVIISMPIIVQGSRIGVINFAYDHVFEFSKTFKAGLELLANTIGTALSNYRLRNSIELKAREIFWSGRQALNYELMQGYRHWAGSAVFKLDGAIDHLVDLAHEHATADLANNLSQKAVSSREELHDAIDSMEELTKDYGLKAKQTSMHDLFHSCARMLRYELSRESIKVNNSNVKDSLLGNEDALRAVFLNLLLNSIQAFRERTMKDCKVTLSLNTTPDLVEFVYSDNGPGLITRGKFSKPEEIWLPGVTSKKKGTGFGMPMIRQVIEKMHGGKIYLNMQSRQRGFSVAGFVKRNGFDAGGMQK